MANSFRDPQVFTIIDGTGKTVGHIKVKPNGVAWCPPGKGAYRWRSLTLKQFADLAEQHGKATDN